MDLKSVYEAQVRRRAEQQRRDLKLAAADQLVFSELHNSLLDAGAWLEQKGVRVIVVVDMRLKVVGPDFFISVARLKAKFVFAVTAEPTSPLATKKKPEVDGLDKLPSLDEVAGLEEVASVNEAGAKIVNIILDAGL